MYLDGAVVSSEMGPVSLHVLLHLQFLFTIQRRKGYFEVLQLLLGVDVTHCTCLHVAL